MHEFVASARSLAKDRGIRAMDIAKRLIDFNFHAPTVYFPLIVPEAMMIEPTETESRETLEAFAKVLHAIAAGRPADAPRRPAQHADQPARRGQGRQDARAQVEAAMTFIAERSLFPASANCERAYSPRIVRCGPNRRGRNSGWIPAVCHK